MVKSSWWKWLIGSSWQACRAFLYSTSISWGWCGRNSHEIPGCSRVRYCIHCSFNVWLTSSLLAAFSCSMCSWMGKCPDHSRAVVFSPSIKWKAWESVFSSEYYQVWEKDFTQQYTPDDLLMVTTMDSSLEDFNADKAIDLWWADKARRPSHKKSQNLT